LRLDSRFTRSVTVVQKLVASYVITTVYLVLPRGAFPFLRHLFRLLSLVLRFHLAASVFPCQIYLSSCPVLPPCGFRFPLSNLPFFLPCSYAALKSVALAGCCFEPNLPLLALWLLLPCPGLPLRVIHL